MSRKYLTWKKYYLQRKYAIRETVNIFTLFFAVAFVYAYFQIQLLLRGF